MAGNVWEWTRSLGSEYPYDPADGREDEGASSDVARVLRGGSFSDRGIGARCSYRYRLLPELRDGSVGFRVAVLPFPLISGASEL
jgi:formylglycine-generating enzyme required for sulfatase activity